MLAIDRSVEIGAFNPEDDRVQNGAFDVIVTADCGSILDGTRPAGAPHLESPPLG